MLQTCSLTKKQKQEVKFPFLMELGQSLSASFKLRLEVEHYCQQLLFVLLCWEFEALLNFIVVNCYFFFLYIVGSCP
jgi:hypothetical protein